LSPCGPSISPRTQLQRTQSRSTRPLAKSSTRLLRATRGPLRFILWARTCACMTTYVQVRNLWAGGRAGQKALFPAFQAGHAGSIPVARSEFRSYFVTGSRGAVRGRSAKCPRHPCLQCRRSRLCAGVTTLKFARGYADAVVVPADETGYTPGITSPARPFGPVV